MSNLLKEFIKIFMPIALGICIVSTWFLYSRNEIQLDVMGQRQETIVSLNSQILTQGIDSKASDARYLARIVARKFNTHSDQVAFQEIEDDFTDFARSHPLYYTIRFLDEKGMELIRLDRSFAGPVVKPQKAMQNKSNRYYFQEAIRAGRDGVYISHFDLNIEHGRIEKPFKPTLRFACPVIDNTGKKRGIVILNFNGSLLLKDLELQASSGTGIPMLTDGQGYWILAADPKDEWGQILEETREASMPNKFPQAWKSISSNEQGQILTSKGLFSFHTINIIPNSVITGLPPTPEKAKLRWKIITWVPSALLHVPWMTLFVSLTGLLIFLLFLGCLHLARNKARQLEIESKLRVNEERTMAISQSAQDAIAMVDDQERITYWNPAAERLFGYKDTEVRGLELHSLLAPLEENPKTEKNLANFSSMKRKRSTSGILEFNALCKDGTQVPVELSVSSFRLKGKWYAVGSMRDITRRKQDELELRRSEETSRALINAPTESAMLVEPNGTILAINEIGARRLGGNAKEMLGQNAFKVFFPDLTGADKNIFKKVLELAKTETFEHTREGRRFLVSVYPTQNIDGSVDRLAIFARDITEQRKAEQALKRSEQRFRDVSEAVSEYIWETNEKGHFKILTDDIISVLGYTSEELIGRPSFYLMPQEDIADYKVWLDDIYGKRAPFTNVELRNITKDGKVIWIQISGVPYYGEEGEFMGYRGAGMNITDRKDAENAVKASERKLRALAESAYDATITIDTNGRVSFWNHAAEKLFGYQESEALGKEVHALIAPPEDRPKAELGMYEFAITGKGPAVGVVEETFALHKNGTKILVERSVSRFKLGDNWFAVATIRDITERKKTEAKLLELATIDSLTGLNNRRRFMELSEQEFASSLRYNRPLAMFMIDIDHFKKVNDTYGHDVGDKVLRAIAKTALVAMRNADILGRFGGEEFTVMLPETDREAALEAAERLRTSVEQTVITTNSKKLNITVSIGVACLDQKIKTIEQFLKRADTALYKAKKAGRNRSIFC